MDVLIIRLKESGYGFVRLCAVFVHTVGYLIACTACDYYPRWQ